MSDASAGAPPLDARQILSGLGWSAIATAVSAACQLAFMAALSRLLDPAAFGLMAMAGVALRFASFFSQLGFAQAIIQHPRLAACDTAAALAMGLACSLLLYAAMALAAPAFALVFRTPELVRLIEVLGLSLVLSTLGGLPAAVLRRAGRFRRVNAIEVCSYVAGFGGVGIACASRGLGVWSLVSATLSQQLLAVVLGFASVRYPLARPTRAACGHLWRYGTRYSLIGFLEFLGGNIETLFIGRGFGKSELGQFNRASMLTNLPVELGVTAVNNVLFPALSGLQHDRRRLADGFQMLLLSTGLFSTAMACGIGAAAPDVVGLLLGARWAGVAPLATVVALSVPPLFMYVACGITLDSLAALGPKLRLQSVVLALKVALVLALARWGLVGVAWAAVGAETARLALGLRLVSRLLALPPARLATVVGLCLATGAAVWTAVGAVRMAATLAGAPLWARVPAEALAGAAALAGALLLLARRWPDYGPAQRFETVRRWHARIAPPARPRAA
jgi:O-antigen/teichoic acid export membrane protein